MLSLYHLMKRVRNGLFTRAVRRKFGAFGAESVIDLPVELLAVEHIEVGKNVHIYPGCIVQSHLGGRISIGHNTELRERVIVTSQDLVTIGPGCAISRGVHISDHTHGYDDRSLDVVDQPGLPPAQVHIGRGTWIGQNVIVMPGVTIGQRAVIGAGSVVTRDIPDFAVAVGAPARVIRIYGADEAQEPAAV